MSGHTETKSKSRIPLSVKLLVSIIGGTVTGLILGKRASGLGELGLLLVTVLKTLATPLVFLAIVDAFIKTHVGLARGVKLIGLSIFNAVVAATLALGVSYMVPVGMWVDLGPFKQAITSGVTAGGAAAHGAPALEKPTLDGIKILKGFIPQSVVEPFASNNVIAVILMAVILGVILRRLITAGKHAEEMRVLELFISGSLRIVVQILEMMIQLVPLAVFAVLAKAVGTTGLTFLPALLAFVGLVTLGILLHAFVYYGLLLATAGRTSPLKFYRDGADAIVTALSVGSSLATLPVTLRCLQDKMKITPQSSRLAACVGTNLNHTGILLYEAVTALFVANAMGIHMDFGSQVLLVAVSSLAAVGIAGVPDAGLVTLSLVLGSVGLPLGAVPLLMPVDWFIGRLRAMTNVISDMVVATLLDRFDFKATFSRRPLPGDASQRESTVVSPPPFRYSSAAEG